MRALNSRFVLVGICAWISCCLLVAGWMPELSGNLHAVWLISGLLGLVSAVGLAETIKSDVRVQEELLNEYMHAAMTDGLTGLANRQALDRTLTSLLREPPHRRGSIAMIMIDIDHFKAFNDQYGHQAGDAVLRVVSRKMQDFFGNKAMVARYGGEEFGIVLPNCRLSDADRLAEACRLTIKETGCEFRERRFSVTISCGVTEANSSDTPDSLTQRADMALYTAKKMGRDMIWIADPNSSGSNIQVVAPQMVAPEFPKIQIPLLHPEQASY
ncbi:GGDEF domain-containing protein [Planctomicrobium sp. SH661]|uniref:GGDEF domain-containing protein n=1 Tax=Planctomicrobium sp. SH661 TaxID=3448124 RepID=UPI003F5CA0D4